MVGREGQHGRYVDALLAELELEHGLLAERLETVFLGGGTPTFTDGRELRRLLAALPSAAEVTVEANPETVTPALARLLRDAGVTRVSLGAQSFQPDLLRVLERRASPAVVRRAFYHLRDANFDNISLDLLHGIPGQSAAALAADIDEALALAPEHISYYELEAKQGTRFAHAHGAGFAIGVNWPGLGGLLIALILVMGMGTRRATVGTRQRTSASPRPTDVTSAHSTTSRTGSGGTTSVWGSARFRRWATNGVATRRGSAPTWARWRVGRRLRVRSRRSTRARVPRSG